jgi:hypothetical protein
MQVGIKYLEGTDHVSLYSTAVTKFLVMPNTIRGYSLV